MRNIKHLLLLLLLLCSFFNARSESKWQLLHHYTTLNGLSNNDVQDIFNDSRGFVWIATNDGLNRFDGYDFKLYDGTTKGLNTNLLLSITEDRRGNLWLGTANKGVVFYNYQTDKFTPISEIYGLPVINNAAVRHVCTDSDGAIWAFSKQTGSIYHMEYNPERPEERKFSSYKLASSAITAQNVRLSAIEGEVFITSNSGVHIARFNNDKIEVEMICDQGASYITRVNSDIILLSNITTMVAYNTKHRSVAQVEIPFSITAIAYHNNTLHLANNDGYYTAEYDAINNQITEMTQISKLDNVSATCMTVDSYGTIWIGSVRRGAYFFGHKLKEISAVEQYDKQFIFSIVEGQENIYIATNGEGLSTISHDLKHKELIFPTKGYIYTTAADQINKKIYFIVAWNGLYSYDQITGQTSKLCDATDDIRTIVPDGDYLWMGAYYDGVIRYNVKSGEKMVLKSSDGLTSDISQCIIKDYFGNIWIATSDGLCRIDAQDRFREEIPVTQVEVLGKGQEDFIVSLLEDANHNIWYGALGGGLKCLYGVNDKVEFELIHYSTDDGLSSNSVKSLIQDDNGVIWAATNKGLNGVDLNNESVIRLDYRDGLQDNQFNDCAAMKCADGRLFFGSVSGINYFNPRHFQRNTSSNTPTITEFEIFNKSITEDNKYKSLVTSNITESNYIKLPNDYNSFTLQFSTLQDRAHKTRYRYILEGYDNSWINTTSNEREVTYSRLPFGKYRFRVMSCNGDGVWSGSERTIDIVIAAPLYLSTLAFITYLALILIASVVIYQYLQRRAYRKRMAFVSKVEKRKSEELLELKTSFFTNMSHEFRTPLTLIISPMQTLLEDKELMADESKANILYGIQYNSQLLLGLINKLLGFSKMESNMLTISYTYGNFAGFAKTIYSQFTLWAQQKGIEIEFTSSHKEIFGYYDPNLMQQVLYNLISNAIKYTPQNHKVSISITDTSESITIEVEDNGIGISEELQANLFKKFYSDGVMSESGGIGIGLYLAKEIVDMHDGQIAVSSKIGQGTKFTITLPKNLSLAETLDTPTEVTEQLVEKNPIAKASTKVEAQEQTNEEASQKPIMLIVDDNKEICKLLSSLFAKDYNISEAYDGRQAWNMTPDLQPDVIISDVMMPHLDGFQLCQKCKEDERTSHIPIILLTAKSGEEDLIEGYKFKADGYMTKPFSNDLLKEMTASIIENRRKANRIAGKIIISPSEVQTSSIDEKFIQKLIKCVEDNIDNPNFVVDDLSSSVGITSAILNKKLKVLVGVTANSFIRSIKIKRAAQMLTTGRFSVADVTYAVGFNDLKHFRNCFKAEFGVLPQDYKERAAAEKSEE